MFKQNQGAAGNVGKSVLPKGSLTGILTNAAKGTSAVVHGATAGGAAEGNSSGKIRPGGYPPSKRKQGNAAGLPMSL